MRSARLAAAALCFGCATTKPVVTATWDDDSHNDEHRIWACIEPDAGELQCADYNTVFFETLRRLTPTELHILKNHLDGNDGDI